MRPYLRSKLIIRLSTYFIHAAQWDWYYSDPTPALCGDNNSTMKNSASICTSMMPTVTELIVSQFKEQLRNGRMTPLIVILWVFCPFLQKSFVTLKSNHEYTIIFKFTLWYLTLFLCCILMPSNNLYIFLFMVIIFHLFL